VSQKDLIFRRKARIDSRGQARLTLPRAIVAALGADLGLIWRDGQLIICPWPLESP